jgi:membrane-anchored mycosin MYCP
VRNTVAGLGLAVAALIPTAPAVPSRVGPAASTTVPAWVGSTTWPSRPIAAKDAAGFPNPPPVDMSLLPSDPGPSMPPGVRDQYACAQPTTHPITNPRAAAPLLWGQQLLQLPDLWRSADSKGAGVRLAVIDTGVSQHRLLAGRLVAGGDYVYSGNGLQDCDGHGTAVAGIAAAAADPETGFSGVAPQAQVIGIRQTSANLVVIDANGRQMGVGDTTSLARAIVEAVRENANVINVSLTSCLVAPRKATPLQAALHYAMLHNVVVVAAAGNTGSDLDPNHGACPQDPDNTTVSLPGWYDADVLTVGSTSPSGIASNFSYPGPWVDVAAPGEGLMSLSLGGTLLTSEIHNLDQPGSDQLGHVDGTSFASPEVAGLAVLIRAKYPDLTARQVVDRITATAKNPTFRDPKVGYGEVNPLAALSQQPEVLPPPSATDAPAGHLAKAPQPPSDPSGKGALWGGILGLLAAVAAICLAVGKIRSGPRQPRHPEPGNPRRDRAGSGPPPRRY